MTCIVTRHVTPNSMFHLSIQQCQTVTEEERSKIPQAAINKLINTVQRCVTAWGEANCVLWLANGGASFFLSNVRHVCVCVFSIILTITQTITFLHTRLIVRYQKTLHLLHQYLHSPVLNHRRDDFIRWTVLLGADLTVSMSKTAFWNYFKCGHLKYLWSHPHEKAPEHRINHHPPHMSTCSPFSPLLPSWFSHSCSLTVICKLLRPQWPLREDSAWEFKMEEVY